MSQPQKRNPYLEEDQEYISHSMDDDYEGGQWVDGEFYYTKAKDKRVQSKDEAIYGVFGDEDEYEDYRQQRQRPSRDMSKPMSFVASGSLQPETKEEEAPAEEGARPGLGSASAAPPSSSTSAFSASSTTPTAPTTKAGFGSRRKNYFGDAPEEAESVPRAAAASAAAAGAKTAGVKRKQAPLDKNFGKFEAHTKGIGMKLLMKMGFKGRLGKNEQGVANPIVAKLRPAKMGLSFGDFKEIDESTNFRNAQEQEEYEAKKAAEQAAKKAAAKAQVVTRTGEWKAGATKVKKVYKTAAELAAEQTGGDVATPEVVVDMRGPHVRVLSMNKLSSVSGDQGWTPTGSAGSLGVLPELQHNVRLLVDLTESDIHKIARERREATERLAAIAKQREQLEELLFKQGEAVSRMEHVIAIVNKTNQRIQSLNAEASTPLASKLDQQQESVCVALELLLDSYPAECRALRLSRHVIQALAFAPLQRLLGLWQALPMAPSHAISSAPPRIPAVAIMARWKEVLSADEVVGMETFVMMVEDLLLPKLRQALISWQIRSFEPVVRLLEDLSPLLPSDTYATIINTIIVPKLKHEINSWNPRVDSTPINQWLHPFIHVVPDEAMQPLYAAIRYKLAMVLQDWHPSDGSAYAVIVPWHNVFKDQDLQSLLGRSIVPKLADMLRREFVVNPHQQYIEPFNWVMAWVELVSPRNMIQLLNNEFFPKWFHALYSWLSSNPDFEEVSKWYMGWKSLFPPALMSQPAMRSLMSRGLDIMNQAVTDPKSLAALMNRTMSELSSGMLIVSSLPPSAPAAAPAAGRGAAGARPSVKPSAAAPSPMEEVSGVDMSFKEIVQSFAEMNGVEFVPNVRRGSHEGHQIYSFGKVSVYLDGQAIFVWQAGQWRPISMQNLLNLAR